MTNIFDWYEDKTPEELAKELGISDLSVVDNAGRETVETFEENNDRVGIYKKAINKEKSMEKYSLRTTDYGFKDLIVGMSLKWMTWEILKLKEIRSKEEIDVYREKNWDEILSTISYEVFKTIFQLLIPEKNWCNKDKRILLSEIEIISGVLPNDLIINWTYVRHKSNSNFVDALGKVDVNDTGISGHKIIFPNSIESWSDYNFKDGMAIYKDFFAQYQLKKAGLWNKWYTTMEINNIEDIKEWDKVVSLRDGEKDSIIKEIESILTSLRPNGKDVILKSENGFNVFKIEYLKEKFLLIVENLDEEYIDIKNSNLWKNNCEFEDLREWMKVKIIENNTVGEIVSLTNKDESILIHCKNWNDTGVLFSDIWTKFSVYKEDLDKASKWTNKFNLKDLKKWMKADSQKMIMYWDVIKVEDGNVFIEVGTQMLEISGKDFLEKFKVLKEDLNTKKPINTPGSRQYYQEKDRKAEIAKSLRRHRRRKKK